MVLFLRDDYVTITDDSEDYRTVPAGSTVVVDNGFAWDVADNIPDMHMVNFEVNVTNHWNLDVWTTISP
ncbi:MAG: hypothetical protein R2764_21185 [Bacteroidales bacterium]